MPLVASSEDAPILHIHIHIIYMCLYGSSYCGPLILTLSCFEVCLYVCLYVNLLSWCKTHRSNVMVRWIRKETSDHGGDIGENVDVAINAMNIEDDTEEWHDVNQAVETFAAKSLAMRREVKTVVINDHYHRI